MLSPEVIRTLKTLTRQAARKEEHVERVDRGNRVDTEPVVHVLRVAEPVVEEHLSEGRQAVADCSGHGDLPYEVEPTCRPAPTRAPHLRRPVVEAAGRRVGRRDLGHRERDDRAHQPDEQPAPGYDHGPASLEADPIRRQAPREDRDDRERDGEVPEPAHRAEELLRVAELVEGLFVLRGAILAGRGSGTHAASFALLMRPGRGITRTWTLTCQPGAARTRIRPCSRSPS